MDLGYGTELLVANLNAGVVRVLVIDDDPDICNGLKDILQDAGYHVETANCAADGRDHFDQQTYSILVVDYSLPDANGIEIARMVRAQYPWVQTILMTGHDRVEISKNHESSPLLGAFLRKPIDVQTILSVMEQMLHRQCDHFQIPRFTPEHDTTPPFIPVPVQAPKTLPVAQPVSVAPVLQKRTTSFSIILLAFLAGSATGWFGRDMAKRPDSSLRRPVPIPVSISVPIPAAVPIEIKPENTLLPPTTETVAVVAIPAPAPTPVIPAPLAVVTVKAPEPPVVDWNAQLESDDASLQVRAAEVLLKNSQSREKAVATLFDLLEDPDTEPAITKASKDALIRQGKAVVPTLISKLEDPQLRGQIVEMLGAIGPAAKEAIPALSALENDPEVGIAALKANAQIQPR